YPRTRVGRRDSHMQSVKIVRKRRPLTRGIEDETSCQLIYPDDHQVGNSSVLRAAGKIEVVAQHRLCGAVVDVEPLECEIARIARQRYSREMVGELRACNMSEDLEPAPRWKPTDS